MTKVGRVFCAEDVAISQSLQTEDKQASEGPVTDTFAYDLLWRGELECPHLVRSKTFRFTVGIGGEIETRRQGKRVQTNKRKGFPARRFWFLIALGREKY